MFFSEAPAGSHGNLQQQQKIGREVIDKIVVTKKSRNKTYLLKDEESYIVETTEIDVAHGLPRGIQTFTQDLQQVFHDLGGKSIGKCIKPSSAQSYAFRLIQRVNINEEGSEGQKQRTRTVMIKFLVLSHKMAEQSDLRLACFMFHNLYRMYINSKNKEEINTDVIIKRMSEHEESNKVNKELKDSHDNDNNNRPILEKNDHHL